MTLVNTDTGEITDAPTYGEVRDSIDSAKASLEAAAEQIVWQIEHRAWTVLGYSDWNEMREAEYGGAAFMVPRAERPELLARMRRSGLTNVEIADTAGVSEATVRNDLNRNSANEPVPTITNARGQQRPTTYSKPAPATADDVIAGRARYADTEGGRADSATLAVEAAVAEFPDLAYYAQTGRQADALSMAEDLRRFRDRGELDERLDNLRRSIAVDRAKRDGTYEPGTTAVMDDDGTYRMRPLPERPAAPAVCPSCGQQIRSNQ